MLWPLLLVAHAQDLQVHPGWMVQPQPGKIYENGIGSPTVAYDPASDTWTMLFETQFGPEDAVGGPCRQGRWGIGRATSPDGLTWTIDDDLVLAPEDDTYFACVVAHPDVLFDGTTWHLWFKAQQTHTICDGGAPAPPWGCNPVTGVGYATSADGVHWTVRDRPAINLFSFGFPSVVEVDGVLRMMLAYANARTGVYELWQSVSVDAGETWSTPQFVLGPGFAPWVDDEIYNPAVTCNPAAQAPFGPYVLFAGGRNSEPQQGGPPQLITAGLGRAFSGDGTTWAWDGTDPIISWELRPPAPAQPDRDWRHWTAMRIGQEYLLYFSERDDLGRNRVGLAYTYPTVQTSFPERYISDRTCAGPDDTGAASVDDTDVAPDDTDEPVEETLDTSPIPLDDTPPPDSRACGCTASAPALRGAGAGLLAVGLLVARRRRR